MCFKVDRGVKHAERAFVQIEQQDLWLMDVLKKLDLYWTEVFMNSL